MKAGLNSTIRGLLERAGAKKYYPALLPESVTRGVVGNCFDWCVIQGLKNNHLNYVEGITLEPGGKKWILHAWLTDGTNAFDPTWQAIDDDGVEHPMPTVYIGVEMPITAVTEFMRTTGYQGILANYWRNPRLANKCLSKGVLV